MAIIEILPYTLIPLLVTLTAFRFGVNLRQFQDKGEKRFHDRAIVYGVLTVVILVINAVIVVFT